MNDDNNTGDEETITNNSATLTVFAKPSTERKEKVLDALKSEFPNVTSESPGEFQIELVERARQSVVDSMGKNAPTKSYIFQVFGQTSQLAFDVDEESPNERIKRRLDESFNQDIDLGDIVISELDMKSFQAGIEYQKQQED